MRTLTLIVILLAGLYTSAFGQRRHRQVEVFNPTPDYQYFCQYAEYPGGDTALLHYLQRKITYPSSALYAHSGGKTLVRFFIDETGNPVQVTVFKSSGNQDLDSEAVRIVRMIPPWHPSKVNGKAIKSLFILPVMFTTN